MQLFLHVADPVAVLAAAARAGAVVVDQAPEKLVAFYGRELVPSS